MLVMKFEILKKSHLKRNIVIGVLVIGVISAVILNFTKAKYRTTQRIPLVNGTINYIPYDFKMVAMYQKEDGGEYVSIDQVPTSGYTLNTEQSYCEVNGKKDSNIEIEYTNGKINFLGMTIKGTKCTLYFDEVVAVSDTLLANYPTKLTRNSFTSTVTNTTTGTIYYADTSKGRTYYFAGNPTDNWVRFGGFYWRIIRINEDGTIRMIYQGTSANITGTGTQIQTSAFNSSFDDNMYVGYMYQSNQVHGLTSSSTIKGILDTWYQNNLTSVADKIDGNAGFCGDRQPSTSSSSSNGSGGTGTTQTYYGGYIRLIKNKVPTFECQNESDLYTTSGIEQGNKALTYPIGLISFDEAWYAGGYTSSPNRSYYLYTNQYYWTMSPYHFNATISRADVFIVNNIGGLGSSDVNRSWGVRPVINLKADVTISEGNGTSDSPYVIS